MRRLVPALALAGLSAAHPAAASAQSSPADGCAEVSNRARTSCLVAAQAAATSQAWLAAATAGGNPTPGSTSGSGLRLGVLPRVSAALTARGVGGEAPDLREARIQPTDAVRYGQTTTMAPALSATATVEVTRGRSVAPTIGGIGALELIGTAGWAALPAADGGVGGGDSGFSYGGGARLGLLRESFGVPGVALSVLYHRLGRLRSGEVCRSVTGITPGSPEGSAVDEGICADVTPGDVAAYALDVGSWSARAAVSKHVVGLGLAAGLGYDRSSSSVDLEARSSAGELAGALDYARVHDERLSQGRWTAFLDGSYSVLVTSITAEAGWLSGGLPVAGYPAASSDFDPKAGSFYASLGLRVAL